MGGLAAGHQHARKLIDDVLSFRGMDQERSRWAVKIADAQGRIVLTVLFPCRQTNLSTSAPVRDARDRLVLQPGFARCSACGGGGAVPCRAGAKPSTGLKRWRRLLGGLPRGLGARSRVDAP